MQVSRRMLECEESEKKAHSLSASYELGDASLELDFSFKQIVHFSMDIVVGFFSLDKLDFRVISTNDFEGSAALTFAKGFREVKREKRKLLWASVPIEKTFWVKFVPIHVSFVPNLSAFYNFSGKVEGFLTASLQYTSSTVTIATFDLDNG